MHRLGSAAGCGYQIRGVDRGVWVSDTGCGSLPSAGSYVHLYAVRQMQMISFPWMQFGLYDKNDSMSASANSSAAQLIAVATLAPHSALGFRPTQSKAQASTADRSYDVRVPFWALALRRLPLCQGGALACRLHQTGYPARPSLAQ